MSLLYETIEHVTVRDGADLDCYVAYNVANSLAEIGKQMLLGNGGINKLILEADGVKYNFNGDEVNEDYKNIIDTVFKSNNIDLIIDYSLWGVTTSLWDDIEKMFSLHPDLKDSVFYSIYERCDGENGGCGKFYAYGTKNGKTYCGPVINEDFRIDDVGVWNNDDIMVSIGNEIKEEYDIEEIKKCAEDYKSMCCEVQFDLTEEDVELYVKNVTLRNYEEIEKYASICKRLHRATNGDCSMLEHFVDTTGPDVSILYIWFNDDGDYDISIEKID